MSAGPVTDLPRSAAHLDRSLVRGIAWTAGLKWLTQVLSWASTIIVARLLTPDDYGLVGMASVYVGLVQLVNEFGLGAAIVQRRDLSADQIARLGGVSVLFGLGFCLVSVVASPAIAAFFEAPAVRWVVVALSTTFLTTAFQVVPRALLQRDLRYPRLAVLDGIEATSITLGTIGFAIAGWGYWSLVAGNLGGRLVGTVVAILARPHRIAWPSPLRSIAAEVAFGSHIVVSRIAWYVYNNADRAIVGRALGSAALGAYGLAWSLANLSVDRISVLVTRVTPAVFSAVQKDPAALRRYLLGLTEGVALVAFPVSAGLALVATPFVHAVLGSRWSGAIVPMQILALYSGFRAISTLLPQILVNTGHARRSMEFSIIAAVVLPLAFVVGSRWGTVGVAIGWVVGYPLVTIPLFYRTAFRIVGLGPGAYLAALWPAASGTIVMAIAVIAADRAIAPTVSPGWRLGALVATGAVVYASMVWGLHAERIRRVLSMARAHA